MAVRGADPMAADRGWEVLAAAKVNLSLRITGRRSDGYHLLDSIVVPISVFDRLRIVVSTAKAPSVSLVCRPESPALGGVNIADQAAKLFLRRSGVNARIQLELEKEIPIGAGMGGGSSDAAAVLRVLKEVLVPALPETTLRNWGLELGADVPFFLSGRPARVRGIGELIEPIPAWPSSPMVVAFAGEGLSTAAVYRAFDAALTRQESGSTKSNFTSVEPLFREPLVNELEAAALRVHPGPSIVKERFLDLGANVALMTGSGSAIFGFWSSPDGAERAVEQMRVEGNWARVVEILSRVPHAANQDTSTRTFHDGR